MQNSKKHIQANNLYEPVKRTSVVLIMVCIYVFLVIERPWESIQHLQNIPIERTFAIALILVAFLHNKFKIVSSPTNKWVYSLLALHFILAPFAFNAGYSINQGIEYSKMVVLYLLMLSMAEDEDSLRVLVKAYIFSMMFYVLHSLWEYHNGRVEWRMGISRMVGVDATFSDPNAFSASIVLSIPFVYALLKTEAIRHLRKFYYVYFVVAIICIILTGSRTSFVTLFVLMLVWALIQQGKRKVLILSAVSVALIIIWTAMPDEKQNRIRTLWNPEAGPENAQASAKGRMQGWEASWEMFKRNPLVGVGAGGQNYIGYRVANHIDGERANPFQAHVLYGEVLAEFGLPGAFLFLGLIISTLKYAWRTWKSPLNGFTRHLSPAIIMAIILLLVLGLGGHNFYRPLWLWLAAWAGAAYRQVGSNVLRNDGVFSS